MELKGKKVLIVGFGRSGKAAARYCLSKGAFVSITDSKDMESFVLSSSDKDLLSKTKNYFGEHPLSLFESSDFIVPSPGVPLNLDGIKKASVKGIPIVGEMALFDLKQKVIAITGTNGKSTTTTLIGEILKEAGKKVAVGGNLGTPLLDMIGEIENSEYVVLEVSSYQLEITPNFAPHVSVLLNITPDHLDRYSSYEEYINAKALVTKNQKSSDTLVFNEDDSLVVKIAEGTKAKKSGFSVLKEYKGLNFSRGKLVGIHNKENMIASALACKAVGVDFEISQKVFEKFNGLAHRNQFVAEMKGVKFFDDSKGTNVGAVVKSLEGFDSKVILIAGGLDKGGSYDPLKPLVKNKVKALVLIGASRKLIASEMKGLTEIVFADSMAAAVREAAARASSGDVVLLSPACASFDMFKDYAERGNIFAEEVKKLSKGMK